MKQISQKCGICLTFYSTRVRDHCPLCGSYKFVTNSRVQWKTWNGNQFIPIARVFPFPVHGLLDRVIAKANKIMIARRKEEMKAERAQYKHGVRKLALERQSKANNISKAKESGEVFLR